MVGEGATSGVAANIDNRVATINEINKGNERIGSDFDSIQRATFNAVRSCQSVPGATAGGAVEYALVALHVSSRQNPNWVWGTFEHQMNPGRCDSIGCFDSFGAEIPAVLPNRTGENTQYGACRKTPPLKTLMKNAGLSPVWENYCLKSTQVDYTAADGTPYAL